jgi:hypothetical protein
VPMKQITVYSIRGIGNNEINWIIGDVFCCPWYAVTVIEGAVVNNDGLHGSSGF